MPSGTYIRKYEKQPNEELPVGWDFAADLIEGEFVSDSTVTCKNMETDTDSSSEILDGSESIVTGDATDSAISQPIHAGTHGDRHNISFSATTNTGFTIEADIILIIKKLGLD